MLEGNAFHTFAPMNSIDCCDINLEK